MAKKKTSKAQRLVILDSHAILHRAYHAIPDFSSSKGEPTGALYGLVSMVLKLIDDLEPDYIVAARDLPGPTVRHELFEEYKAKRVKADDELIEQLKRAPKVFEAFGIPVYEAVGFEADDIVGSIVKQAAETEGVDVVIASGDADMLQLVEGKHVQVYTLRKGLNDTVLYDEDRVRERYGFGPEHIVDYKALRGDPSDGIIGVRGIGEKTATELIDGFGPIEKIYESLDTEPDAFAKDVKPRIVELLKTGRESATLSKVLATIRTDVPIKFELPDHHWRIQDHAATAVAMCDELEFRSLKERISRVAAEAFDEPYEAEPEAAAPDEQVLKETAVALWLLHSDTTNPSLEEILRYAGAQDFEKAREFIFAALKKTGRLQDVYEKIEKPLIGIVERMHEVGIFVDTAYLKSLSKEYSTELGKIAGRIFAHAGHEFNINSPKQLGVVLYDELKILPEKQKKTAGGARTTREDELVKLSSLHPIIDEVLAYRELQKLLSTYIEKMPALIAPDGRLHAEFLQTGTTTGRMGCQNPNLQNIPVKTENGKRIRRAFAASKGKVFAAIDYSQIELRIAAGLSGDKKLIEVFKSGGDVHTAVASEVFGVPPEKVDYEMRRRAKVINFGILYGMGVNALRANLGGSVTRDEAQKFLDDYFKKFSGLAEYVEKTKAEATKLGYTETIFGRRRYFPALKSAMPNMRAQAERMAINAPMQGTQSDIIKLAMAEADAFIKKEGWEKKAELLLQVHDELVYELDEKEAEKIARELRRIMESVIDAKQLRGVPIVAEISIGKNWGETKRIPR